MSRRVLAGAGLAVFALALIVTAPATLLDSRLARQSEGRIRLAEAQGTLWSGSGLVEIRATNLQSGIAKHLRWRLRPAYLLRVQLVYEVFLDHAPNPFLVALQRSRADVTDADIALPAAAFGLAEPRLAALELTGDVQLHVARLTLSSGTIQGNATLQWRAAGSALAPVSPLGDYELSLEGDGGAVRGSLRTLRGPLQLDGQGSWSPGRNPEFQGTARVPPQHQQQLTPLLRLIAIDRGGGIFSLQMK
ncbi:MAG: hypothetical protein A3I63_10840 [Betaproteobacteria bacterium RIFCSPLOWO2_02_FULL_66_14]|nr:MAG: hypothetical protein A3I63_10840 [Betaproteobacteria bacterium RIFCSPLOWO2_02_FULL_66_14]